ncbi:MAG: hypothetical protein ACO3Q7_10910, partial [Steroidobacteraceae bacterium]
MTVLRLSSVSPSIIDISSDALAEQLEAVLDGLRRMYGAANVARSGIDDVLLSSQYALYVNAEIGSDDYVAGSYNSDKGILNQEYHCGYSPYRPFKTLARAYAEVARRSILAGPSNDIYDRAVIFIDLTDQTADNAVGSTTVQAWAEGPISAAQLRALNDATSPGVIVPRGVSVIGRDLRRTVIRPGFVPAPGGNAVSGRAALFRVTGGTYFANFTIKDNAATAASHHLLHTHEFCSNTDLVEYYAKIQTIFGLTGAEVINPGETEIVGPAPTGDAIEATDTVDGASPYIFGCSLRSVYGMCGPLLDGRVVTGFKSMEAAQYTIISLQKDWSAFERYSAGEWVPISTFTDYLNANINDIRYRAGGSFDYATATYSTDYRHFGFKLIGDAFIQEVSEFVIGPAVHQWCASGSNADLSNCNSAFGGIATLAHGFRGITTASGALPQDQNYQCVAVRRPLAIKTDGSNIKQITLGRVAAAGYVEVSESEAYIELETPFDPSALLRGNSAVLQENHYIWISNANPTVGPGANPESGEASAVPVRARLAAVPWTEEFPNRIYVKPGTGNNIAAPEDDLGLGIDNTELAGNTVYIRRLIDTRLPEEREYGLVVVNSNPAANRKPQGNFILRLGGRSSRQGQLDPVNGSDEVYIVSEANRIAATGNSAGNYYKLLLRPGDLGAVYNTSQLYRPAVPVLYGTRVYRSAALQKNVAPDSGDTWATASLPFSTARGIEWPRSQAAPRLVLDKDIDPSPTSTNLGINFNTDVDFIEQLRSATDFQAVARLMAKLGYATGTLGLTGSTLTNAILAPQAAANRDWDPAATSSPTPAGKLTQKAHWPLEFNAPSTIEARNQIFRYIGLLNYSKSLPKYQKTVLTDQHKIDAVTMSMFGGRSYADGSIENGLTIQGDKLTDLATGRDFTIESVGIGALDEVSSALPNSLTGDYTITGNLEIQQSLTVGGDLEVLGEITNATFAEGVLPQATTETSGIVRLATVAEAQGQEANDRAVTPAGLVNALGSAIKGTVNVRLSLSSGSATPINIPDPDGDNPSYGNTIYLHPFKGNDIALFNSASGRWQLLQLTATLGFPISSFSLPAIERNYDIYLYNAGGTTSPSFQLDLVAWSADRTPPTRGVKDGVLVKDGAPARRYMGVIRIDAQGRSRMNLGGTLSGAQSANYPKAWLANFYNPYETRLIYFFSNSWPSDNTWSLSTPPTSVYPTPPRLSWVQAENVLTRAYLSIYNDPASGVPLNQIYTTNPIGNVYVAASLNKTSLGAYSESSEAFTAETQAPNTTVIAPFSSVTPAGFHEL